MLHIIKAPSLLKLERILRNKLNLDVGALSLGRTPIHSASGVPCSATIEFAAHPVPHYIATLLTGRDALAAEIAQAGSAK
jgi:hypothetical protein